MVVCMSRRIRVDMYNAIFDYLGLADQSKRALGHYTQAGGRGKAAIKQEEAVAGMIESNGMMV